jgi:hypothetical protein
MSHKSFKQFFNEECGLRHSDEEEIKYIGSINSWHDDPPVEYKQHLEDCCETVSPRPDYSYKKCPTVTRKVGRNREEITCKKCGIQWMVES